MSNRSFFSSSSEPHRCLSLFVSLSNRFYNLYDDGYNIVLLSLMFPRKPHFESNRTLFQSERGREIERMKRKCAMKCFFNGKYQRKQDEPNKKKNLLLNIIADLHFSVPLGLLCVVSKTACTITLADLH